MLILIPAIHLIAGFALGAMLALSLAGCNTNKPLSAVIVIGGVLAGSAAVDRLLLNVPLSPTHLIACGIAMGLLVFHRSLS